MAEVKEIQKYDLGAAVDKELVFNFHYISHDDTVSYIQQYGKVMFIIRGPPSTGKATLSDMLCDKYPTAAFCCANNYFKNTFDSPVRNKITLSASHAYCKKKAESACITGVNTIIIQNTHMKKWEMQPYLDFAAHYNYTVIMAITLYRFNVTPQALLANSTDGLDIDYFRRRLLQWEDVPPHLTGWFLMRHDTVHLQTLAMESLEKLLADGKFCRIFNIYESDQITNYFKVREVSYCLAGYSSNRFEMKKYYLNPEVQYVYGKCFKITILGYYLTPKSLKAIVKVDDEMKPLIFEDKLSTSDISDQLSAMEMPSVNFCEFTKTRKFELMPTEPTNTACTEDWSEGEDIDILQCSFILLAERNEDVTNIGKIRKQFQNSLHAAADNNKIDDASYTELEGNVKTCRVLENEWLIKADKKIVFETIFTGFYP